MKELSLVGKHSFHFWLIGVNKMPALHILLDSRGHVRGKEKIEDESKRGRIYEVPKEIGRDLTGVRS